MRVSARACPRRPTLPEIESLELCVVELLRRGMQVILAQVAYDLPIQDGCPWHRVSSALYNGLLGQRASYAAVCEKKKKSNLTCTGAFMKAAGAERRWPTDQIPSLIIKSSVVKPGEATLMCQGVDNSKI